MVERYETRDQIPKTYMSFGGKIYTLYQVISDDDVTSDDILSINKKLQLENKESAFIPIDLKRTSVWAVYVRDVDKLNERKKISQKPKSKRKLLKKSKPKKK